MVNCCSSWFFWLDMMDMKVKVKVKVKVAGGFKCSGDKFA